MQASPFSIASIYFTKSVPLKVYHEFFKSIPEKTPKAKKIFDIASGLAKKGGRFH